MSNMKQSVAPRVALALCLAVAAGRPLEAQNRDMVVLTGTLVSNGGSPLARKTVCILFQTDDGKWFFPLDISTTGQLRANTVKTNSQEQFTIRLERHEELKVGMCEGVGITQKPVKASKIYQVPKDRKAVALGRVMIE